MSEITYTLHIDAFTPETLPQKRLAEYLSALSDLFGSEDYIHFDSVKEGSACLVSRIDPIAVENVESRINQVNSVSQNEDVRKAFKRIDDMLADDVAVGKLLNGNGGVIIPFPGRTRPPKIIPPAFKQMGYLDGQLVKIGGKDTTSHVTLQNGNIIYSNIELKRELAKQLCQYLYGDTIRIFGEGTWRREANGKWQLITFKVQSFETLDELSLEEAIQKIREIPENGLLRDDVYQFANDIRNDGNELN